MATTFISANTEGGVSLGGGTHLVVAVGANLTNFEGVAVESAGSGIGRGRHDIHIAGSVYSSLTAIYLGDSSGLNNITIFQGAIVSSLLTTAINLSGDRNSIHNAGELTAHSGGFAILTDSDSNQNTVFNTGIISAVVGLRMFGDFNDLTNLGSIIVTSEAVRFGSNASVMNAGTIFTHNNEALAVSSNSQVVNLSLIHI